MSTKRKVGLSTRSPRQGDLDWNTIVKRAKLIVESYDTGVTLRQLYYRLVSEGLIPNRQQAYKTLSMKTAQARREGWFPALIDRTREIERYNYWLSADDAMLDATESFRLDRTDGQEWSVYLGVEKHGMSVQLMHWFGKLGIPVLALGGYSSQTFVDQVKHHVESYGRSSVLLYAGDFDASGVDIDRDFEERTDIFDEVQRVALNSKQIGEYKLPPMPGKRADSRSASFILAHGELIQVELDALPPEELRKLYQAALDGYWDEDAYKATLKREKKQRELLRYLNSLSGMSHRDMATQIVKSLNQDDTLHVADAVHDRLV
jgi:hypothetical protein